MDGHTEKTLLSFVIPCYRSECTIQMVVEEIIAVVGERQEYDYEIVCVNDCSPDGVYEVLQKLAAKNHRIKLVNLSKNVGKASAVLAGYAYVSGEYVVNLDDDCQCPVNELWNLLEPIERDSCDVATASYSVKKESLWKRIGSEVNVWMSRVLLDKPKGLRMENFFVIKRFVCDEILRYRNPFPYLEGLILQATKRIAMVPMEERERGDDQGTGFSFGKSLSLFSNGLTAFSVIPLRIASVVGMLFAIVGFFMGIYTVVHKLLHPEVLLGWSSLVAILLFASGMIMLMLGMIGEYVGRIYICINNAPQYVVRETVNCEVVR